MLGRVDGGHHGRLVDVAHQGDLALHRVGDVPVGPADHRVGLDADLAQRGHRVLGRLGLQLTAGPDVGHQRDVQEEHVLPADVVPHLAGRLQEGQRLDVADGPADLVDDHVDVGPAHGQHGVLDLVGDVRDHLHGVAQVVAPPLLGDHRGVDLAGGDVGLGRQVDVEEPLVVADVEVGLRAVLGDEHLAVLERVHRARVDVEVGVQLLHGDAESAGHQQAAQAGCGQPLAERGGDPAGHEKMLGEFRAWSHGPPAYRRTPAAAGCRAELLPGTDHCRPRRPNPCRFPTQRGKPTLSTRCNLCTAPTSHAAWES